MDISKLPKEFTTQIKPSEIIKILQDYAEAGLGMKIGMLHYNTSSKEFQGEIKEYIEALKQLPDVPIKIINFEKMPRPEDRVYAEHLLLSKEIIDLTIVSAIKNAPKIDKNVGIFAESQRIISRWVDNQYFKDEQIGKAVTGYITNKKQLPIVFALKACSLQGYANHPYVLREHHASNDRLAFYDTYAKQMNEFNSEPLKSINMINAERFKGVELKVDELVELLNKETSISESKELCGKLKKLETIIKSKVKKNSMEI